MVALLAALWSGCLTPEMQDSSLVIADRAFAAGDSATAWKAWDAGTMDRFACQLPGSEFEKTARKIGRDTKGVFK